MFFCQSLIFLASCFKLIERQNSRVNNTDNKDMACSIVSNSISLARLKDKRKGKKSIVQNTCEKRCDEIGRVVPSFRTGKLRPN